MEKLELVAAGGISPIRTDPDLVLLVKWVPFLYLCSNRICSGFA